MKDKNNFEVKEEALVCSCNNIFKYPTISPCIITLVTNKNKILLARNKLFPQGMFSALAGFIEAGETAEEALNREVKEEVKEENGCESLESRTGKRRSESESPRAREASKWVTREPYY